MKDYYGVREDEHRDLPGLGRQVHTGEEHANSRIIDTIETMGSNEGSPQWMTLFISLMLVLLSLFIFLTTFSEKDKKKIEIFKKQFREELLLPSEERKGAESIVNLGGPVDPLLALINRMKSKGVNKKTMDDFLTLNQIKDLEVRDGKKGVVIILPEVIGFSPGKNELTGKTRGFLSRIKVLVEELPYLVEIKGYCSGKIPAEYTDALEFSAKRATTIYDYFLTQNVAPEKLKVSGCGDAFQKSDVPQDKVEIIFKETSL
ncbi:MAG: OmpA family protein [bacterium]|nr:OmpA family protein [bacterium]